MHNVVTVYRNVVITVNVILKCKKLTSLLAWSTHLTPMTGARASSTQEEVTCVTGLGVSAQARHSILNNRARVKLLPAVNI